MIHATEDDLREISNVFLGPERARDYWPEARYITVVIGFGLALVVGAAFAVLRVPPGFWTLAAAGGAVIYTTRWIGGHITYETPFTSIVLTCWAELSAPRLPTRVQRITLRPSKVKGLQ